MTRGWARVTSGVCLLLSIEMLSVRCYAAPQEQKDGSQQAAKKREASEPSKQGGQEKSADDGLNSGAVQHDNRLGLNLLENIAADQKAIWTSPSHLRLVDADWLLPLGIATGGMLATDTEYSKHLSNSPSRLKLSNNFSNYGLGAFVGAGAGFYFWGRMTHDEHKSETGLLAGEAAADSFAVVYGLKYAFGRQRPLQNNYHGDFWSGGDSFPSEHAAAAWSIASVVAHEYPGPLTTFLAYGLAAGVSASRISAKQHFPTDVLISSAIGWYIGQHVYRAHHDPELGGGPWDTYAESRDSGPNRAKGSVGSPYVELDSWIYPALERLAALGYIQTAFIGMRPWTRIECAHLVEEAGERIGNEQAAPLEVRQLHRTLTKEFRGDLEAAAGPGELSGRIESIYARTAGIAGKPLNDSYHFGQTIINDYGRPYQEGFNSVDGFSAYGTEGRFTLYVRGEYQHAPSAPAYSDSVRDFISIADGNPVKPATPFATVNQFRLLDTYIAATVDNWDLAFGKQSLWWAPDRGSAMLFSNNAEPIYMFRASRIAPFTLPWIFHYLGPMKVDLFFGKLSGNEFPPRPLIHGEKFSFKPTPNLEFAFTRTVEIGGVGRALTFGHVWRSYFVLGDVTHETPANDPGKRTGGFEFSYRVPFVRNWLTVYTDSLSDDDPSPIDAPRRAGFNPGIYMPKLPGLPKVDLRIEAVYTDFPTAASHGGHFIYYDSFYRDLYTNKNNIIGSWIGREGQGFQAWSTYWFNARNSMQFGYRHARVDSDFIPHGGTVNDGSVSVSWWQREDFQVSTFVQYEKWNFPLLAASPQTNWTASVQVGFWPRSWSK